MNESQILFILLSIVLVDFLWEQYLDWLNNKKLAEPLPETVKNVYDSEEYTKYLDYQRVNSRFSKWQSSILMFLTLMALIFGWFGDLDGWIRTFSPLEWVTSLVFFGCLYLISFIISIPFELYQQFKIEQDFGFNTSTFKTFITDKIKGIILTTVIGGLLLTGFILIVAVWGTQFWIYFWVVIVAFMFLTQWLYTAVIMPWFNKLTPLPEGELRNRLLEFSQGQNFPFSNVLVMDGSKRSSKANAFFTGFGRRKKVVLYDTLIETHSVDELTSVFAHEVGHYKHKHIIWSLALGIVQTGFILFLLSLIIKNSEVSYALGGNMTAVHLNLLAFGILLTPVSHFLGVFMNAFSRKNEFEADRYAAKTTSVPPMKTALIRLSKHHLSHLNPHPLYVKWHYSHPPLVQRIAALDSFSEKK